MLTILVGPLINGSVVSLPSETKHREYNSGIFWFSRSLTCHLGVERAFGRSRVRDMYSVPQHWVLCVTFLSTLPGFLNPDIMSFRQVSRFSSCFYSSFTETPNQWCSFETFGKMWVHTPWVISLQQDKAMPGTTETFLWQPDRVILCLLDIRLKTLVLNFYVFLFF